MIATAEHVGVVVVDASGGRHASLLSAADHGVPLHLRTCRPDLGELVAELQRRPAQVLVLDADPVAGKAALWVSLIKSMQPSLRVLLLVSSAPTAEALEWFAAGADGCLLKSSPREAVASAIRELMEGGAPLAPLVARQLLNALQSDGAQGALGRLSLRERQVLEALAHGSAYKEIAQLLHLSLDTVRSYVRRLYTKLQVHSRGEAVSWWIRRRHLGNQSKAMMERWREA